MSNEKVLIVEDDADARLVFQVLLRANGYVPLFAADAASAIKEARGQSPDLILLDLGLPAGDGFVVLSRLSAMPHLAVIPVVVVSGRDAQGNRERALAAGARAYLQKPWDTDELLELIAQMVGRSD